MLAFCFPLKEEFLFYFILFYFGGGGGEVSSPFKRATICSHDRSPSTSDNAPPRDCARDLVSSTLKKKEREREKYI